MGKKQARPCLFPTTYGQIRREEKRSSAVNVIITVNKSKSVLGCEFADGEITGAHFSSFLVQFVLKAAQRALWFTR